jgi:hypothetical protein
MMVTVYKRCIAGPRLAPRNAPSCRQGASGLYSSVCKLFPPETILVLLIFLLRELAHDGRRQPGSPCLLFLRRVLKRSWRLQLWSLPICVLLRYVGRTTMCALEWNVTGASPWFAYLQFDAWGCFPFRGGDGVLAVSNRSPLPPKRLCRRPRMPAGALELPSQRLPWPGQACARGGLPGARRRGLLRAAYVPLYGTLPVGA